jgi:crotonobetainyl-CoA:carnitine CoA-transferase CaiB-like acyl-CoA transferase
MFWGLSSGFHNNNWPGNADSLLSGGSPRYNIYRTSDNGYIAAAPLEDRFWKNFCELIELPAKYIEKNYNPIETIQKIRALINLKTKKQWSYIFLQADCCCSIVKSLEEAMDDNHFKYREILSRKVSNIDGSQIPALPIPINNQFRNSKLIDEAPEIGSSNNEFIN